MVEYEQPSWDRWLEDATLFPTAKPNDILNFDELLNDKAINDVTLDIGLDDLKWLDEKVNLSVLDCNPTEEEYALLNDVFNLLDQPADDMDSFCSSPDVKIEASIVLEDNIIQNQVDPVINFPIASPCYEAISEANSPASFGDSSEKQAVSNEICFSPGGMVRSPAGQVVPVEFCLSPDHISYCSSPRGNLSNDFCQSPSNTLHSTTLGEQASDDFCLSPSYSNLSGTDEELSTFPGKFLPSSNIEDAKSDAAVSVVVCEMSPHILHTEEALSLDEVTNSVRKRKFVNDGKQIPNLKVSLKNVFHPYSKTEGRRLNKNDRKKVQNKEAAARYRMKKKNEVNEISNEVSILESQQEELQKKHDALLGEIKYLKSLMCEILTKKGIMK
ncbi:cyclic AMP-dependent transcription factor ATF-4 [Nephila pilipes]|uniref:Cyclic AMP-dependent transcription factor ATF-4 n=1 Tax=Nephila pilipes TaxID=299642 RepID=A0A8X6UJT1_NEPPI|nr:cyclic AMP-dependent transcription factor ATF-4 [Nephila pilipes]